MAGAKGGATKRKAKDPDAPKRPTTAFFFFVKHCREKKTIQADRVCDYTKKCAEKWRDIGKAEKDKFDALAAKDKERYDAEMKIYKPETGKPKKPLTAFLIYVASVRPQLKESGLENTKILVEAGAMWKALDKKGKAPFETEAKEAKKKHLLLVEKWEQEQKELKASGGSAAPAPAKKAKKPEPQNGADESDEESEEESEEDESE